MSTAGADRDIDIRAVVVDDSRFMRTLIRRLLEEGGIEVVAEVGDGEAAVEAVATHRPDVVTMDIEMPGMNGIEAVEGIMADCPTPVLMLSAHAEENADVTFEALDRGAVDFVTKPGGEVTSHMNRVERELIEKVRSAAAVDLSAAARTREAAPAGDGTATAGGGTASSGTGASAGAAASAGKTASAGAAARGRSGTYPDHATLVVGASTGGPNVVEGVLAALPTEANLRVLVVQHMPEGFTGRFATRLDDRTRYRVGEATDGDRIGPGEARVAPGGSHLVVADDRAGRLRLELRDSPPVHGVRPAIDPAMTTAAEAVDGPLLGVLLTGMGRDGVEGMRRIHRRDGHTHTVAQDEASSAIFGMPKRAIEADVVDAVRPADEVADSVLDALARD